MICSKYLNLLFTCTYIAIHITYTPALSMFALSLETYMYNSYTHTLTHPHSHLHIHTTLTLTPTPTHSIIYTHTHTHPHLLTYPPPTHKHTRTHMHPHTHTHIPSERLTLRNSNTTSMTAMTTPAMKKITPITIRAMFHTGNFPSQTVIQTCI